MAEITAKLVKELREKTGAGMMDAKKALVETSGDIEAAVDWLRTKGLAKAEKKSGRTAAEGLVCVAANDAGTKAAVVEVNAETDFVARNEQFQAFVGKVAAASLNATNLEALKNLDMDGKSVADTLTSLIATIGENMSLRRVETMEVTSGVVASYVHSAVAPNAGKIGVLVGLESTADQATLAALGKQIAMHVAAANPQFLDSDSVDPAVLEREKTVLIDQAKESGKPDNIIEKMVEGRMKKFLEEICLVDQVFVIDGETRISDVVANAAKEAGTEIKLTGFTRMVLGDGIEKEEGDDFATEVAKAVNG